MAVSLREIERTSLTFQPVTFSVHDKIIDHHHGDKHDGGFVNIEVQAHVHVDAPSDDHHERSDKKSYLHAAANRHTQSQVHLMYVHDERLVVRGGHAVILLPCSCKQP